MTASEKIDEIYEFDDICVKGFFREHSFLSNFHVSDVWFEGELYPSSECAYQAAKIKPDNRTQFLTCTTAKSKKIWKSLPKLYTPDQWNKVKYNIMFRIIMEKFLTNPKLLNKLKATSTRYLEETNYWGDTYWGVCDGVGENKLGEILMNVRETQFPNRYIEPLF